MTLLTVQSTVCAADLSKANPFERVSYDAPVMEALKAFSTGFHRLAVTQGSPANVVKMMSQMCLIQFFLRHVPLRMGVKSGSWGKVLDCKLGQLQLGSEPKSVPYHYTTLDAFALMQREKISGTAIVDDDGKLYGSISVWDLKHASITTGTVYHSSLGRNRALNALVLQMWLWHRSRSSGTRRSGP